MFLGAYQHTLDPKGRVILPRSFRDELKDGLVVTINQDSCLAVYAAAVWQEVAQGVRRLQNLDYEQRRFARALLANAVEQQLDNQGRVTLPVHLRSFAGLTKDVTVTGNDRHVELWDRTAWDSYQAEALRAFAATDRPFDGMGGLP